MPARKLNMALSEDEENAYNDTLDGGTLSDEPVPIFDADKTDIRPMTSILRVRSAKRNTDEEARPKTTNTGGPRRRVTLIDVHPSGHTNTSGDTDVTSGGGISLNLSGEGQTRNEGRERDNLTETANDVLILRQKKSRRKGSAKGDEVQDDISTASVTPRMVLSEFTTPRIHSTRDPTTTRSNNGDRLNVDINIAPTTEKSGEFSERMPDLVKPPKFSENQKSKSSNDQKSSRKNSYKDAGSEHGEVLFLPRV